MKQTIGQNIKQARKKRGKSQTYLADILNINQSNISKIENDIQKPTVEQLKIICEELNISSDKILNITLKNEQ